MNAQYLYFLLILATVAGLGGLLFWSLRLRGTSKLRGERLGALETPGGHVVHLPQIRRALERTDLSFLELRGSRRLSRKVKKERTRVVMRYVTALQVDFDQLIRLARVIAVLSPEVAPAQEWERVRLGMRFALHCNLVKTRLALGLGVLPQLSGVGQIVSGLALRLERAMTELGERAALASELASSLNH